MNKCWTSGQSITILTDSELLMSSWSFCNATSLLTIGHDSRQHVWLDRFIPVGARCTSWHHHRGICISSPGSFSIVKRMNKPLRYWATGNTTIKSAFKKHLNFKSFLTIETIWEDLKLTICSHYISQTTCPIKSKMHGCVSAFGHTIF